MWPEVALETFTGYLEPNTIFLGSRSYVLKCVSSITNVATTEGIWTERIVII